MVFKIKKKEVRETQKKKYIRASADSPKRLYGYRTDGIDLDTLFELRKLESGPSKKPRKTWFSRVLKKIGQFFALVFSYAKEKFRRKRKSEKKWVAPALAGALCAALLVSGISAFAVLYKLFISDYFGRYERATVPDLVGENIDTVRDILPESFNLSVSYEYSEEVPYGEVISQTPAPNVERKIFAGGSLPTLNILVSLGRETRTMSNYVGKSSRDATLELRNMGISVVSHSEYSDSVPRGCVISSTPAPDENFFVKDTVSLTVSLGKKQVKASVPSVVGLTEYRAARLIDAAGLDVGTVKYRNSSTAAGTVISQSPQAYSGVVFGSDVSLVVSAGEKFYEKRVPNLYGLTLEKAKRVLADYGLVLGEVYAAESSEPSGTVIAQSPAPDSDITPSVVTVDLYISE